MELSEYGSEVDWLFGSGEDSANTVLDKLEMANRFDRKTSK